MIWMCQRCLCKISYFSSFENCIIEIMDQKLKIIPWTLNNVMRLTSQSHYSGIRTPPSTNFVHTILLKKRHEIYSSKSTASRLYDG